METTHTPQGDGNRIIASQKLCTVETTYTPPGDEN